MGMPALICAWREGIWPWPAWSTWPMTTCSTCSGSTFARSSAASMAMPPSSVASRRGEAAARACRWGCGRRRGSRSWACGLRVRGEVSAARAEAPARWRSVGQPLPWTRATTRPRRDRRRHRRRRALRGRGRRPRRRRRRAAGAGRLAARPSPRCASSRVTHAAGRRWMLVGLGARDELRRRARARRGRRRARPRARARHALAVLGAAPPRRRRSRAALRRGHAAGRLRLPRATSPTPTTSDGGPLASSRLRPPRRRAARCAAAASSPRRSTRARDLQNAPANDLTPTAPGRARARARRRARRLQRRGARPRRRSSRAGMGAFAAVAQGTDEEPRADHAALRARRAPAVPCSASSARR